MMKAYASWADGEVPATLTAGQLLEWGARRLEESAPESAALDASLLAQHALGCTREALLRADVMASDSAVALYDALIARRAKREPVAKIIGRRAFWKQEFLVSAATLDPRPDSETLIEAALRHRPPYPLSLQGEGRLCDNDPLPNPPPVVSARSALRTTASRKTGGGDHRAASSETVRSVLDLGTGTGCLLLSLLGEYKQARGVGVDISDQALSVAAENAKVLGMENRTEFRVSDWCAAVEGQYDIILCNPPYIAERDADALTVEVRKYDPAIALLAGADGLDAYRNLLPQVARRLTRNGLLLLELGRGQAEAVAALATAGGLAVVESCHDLVGITRVLVCRAAAHA